jgi:hypothetical protein
MARRSRYLLELAPASGRNEDVRQLAARARAAAEAMRSEGVPVRFLRSIYVPEDGACFFLYEGDSVETVRRAGRRARVTAARIDAALEAGDE